MSVLEDAFLAELLRGDGPEAETFMTVVCQAMWPADLTQSLIISGPNKGNFKTKMCRNYRAISLASHTKWCYVYTWIKFSGNQKKSSLDNRMVVSQKEALQNKCSMLECWVRPISTLMLILTSINVEVGLTQHSNIERLFWSATYTIALWISLGSLVEFGIERCDTWWGISTLIATS